MHASASRLGCSRTSTGPAALPCPPCCSGSVYLHKDRDQPLAAGPIWDLNEAFGLCCGYPIEGWDKQGVSGPGAHAMAQRWLHACMHVCMGIKCSNLAAPGTTRLACCDDPHGQPCRPGRRLGHLARGLALHDLRRPGALPGEPHRRPQPLVQARHQAAACVAAARQYWCAMGGSGATHSQRLFTLPCAGPLPACAGACGRTHGSASAPVPAGLRCARGPGLMRSSHRWSLTSAH